MGKLCPFNGFKECIGETCALAFKVEKAWGCAITAIAEETFTMADIKLKEQAKREGKKHGIR